MNNCNEENVANQPESNQKSRCDVSACYSVVIKVNRRQFLFKILNIFLFLVILSSIIVIVYIYFTRDVQVDGWEKGKIRRASLYVHPNNDTSFTHAEANICSIERPLVIIIVCSDTKNISLRKAIRETWANDAKKYNIMILFLIGISEDEDINMETLKESTQYKDMITEDVIDTYNNLTLKSIYMLKWVKENCMQARFLMKADDDTYIIMKNLFQYASLVKDEDLSTFLIGKVQTDANPHRLHYSKWYMPLYMYPYDEYPTYVHGVAYLMSTQVAEQLYNQSLQNEFIHLEDVYITGICAQQINIKPKDDSLFHFFEDPISAVKCRSNQTELIVLSHHTNVYHMYKFYNQLKEC